MEQIGYEAGKLDAIFAALSDSKRRAILARLSHGTATVNELAEPFDISQPAVSRHLKVLERAGLIERGSDRQTRPAILNAEPMKAAVAWLEEFQGHWNVRFDRLDQILTELTDRKDT